MSQEEIMTLLEKEGRPLSLGQIAKELNKEAIKVSMTIRRLLKSNEVKCFELDRVSASKFSGDPNLCRRARFYYPCEDNYDEKKIVKGL